MKLAGKEQNINPTWKVLMKDIDLGEPTSFLDHVYLVEAMEGNSWKDLANWRTKLPSNCTKSQLHALMTINAEKNWDLLEICQKFAHRLFQNACIWPVLVDLICDGP